MTTNNSNWKEYERLVLAELERLDENDKEIHIKLDRILTLSETVADLKKWKEVKVEPDLQAMKTFQTQMKVYGTVGQVVIAAIISFIMNKL